MLQQKKIFKQRVRERAVGTGGQHACLLIGKTIRV